MDIIIALIVVAGCFVAFVISEMRYLRETCRIWTTDPTDRERKD